MSAAARAFSAQQEQRRRRLVTSQLLAEQRENENSDQRKKGESREPEASSSRPAGPPPSSSSAPLPPSRSQQLTLASLHRLHPTATFLATRGRGRGRGGAGGPARRWSKYLPGQVGPQQQPGQESGAAADPGLPYRSINDDNDAANDSTDIEQGRQQSTLPQQQRNQQQQQQPDPAVAEAISRKLRRQKSSIALGKTIAFLRDFPGILTEQELQQCREQDAYVFMQTRQILGVEMASYYEDGVQNFAVPAERCRELERHMAGQAALEKEELARKLRNRGWQGLLEAEAHFMQRGVLELLKEVREVRPRLAQLVTQAARDAAKGPAERGRHTAEVLLWARLIDFAETFPGYEASAGRQGGFRSMALEVLQYAVLGLLMLPYKDPPEEQLDPFACALVACVWQYMEAEYEVITAQLRASRGTSEAPQSRRTQEWLRALLTPTGLFRLLRYPSPVTVLDAPWAAGDDPNAGMVAAARAAYLRFSDNHLLALFRTLLQDPLRALAVATLAEEIVRQRLTGIPVSLDAALDVVAVEVVLGGKVAGGGGGGGSSAATVGSASRDLQRPPPPPVEALQGPRQQQQQPQEQRQKQQQQQQPPQKPRSALLGGWWGGGGSGSSGNAGRQEQQPLGQQRQGQPAGDWQDELE
ncbi:hypothetical protein Agub_g1245, partial [Astrephomene gubernaculifera]